MRRPTRKVIFLASLAAVGVVACQTAEQAFVGRRLEDLCDSAYYICNLPAGCIIDNDHYVAGAFPGALRVVVATEGTETAVQVRLLFSAMEAPGSELLVQMYEPDCTLDPHTARAMLEDVDIFEEAGDDRTLLFDLEAAQEGEHLIEVYSDTSADFILVVEVSEPGAG